ncbi:MAG: undecaprenyl-phosphate glucose phosphotransferase [Motiliproteus sp.]|nr:undecaprenyl-phosphate glucose phosphotransferase [Motiliproteus sp.]MCW9053448.1 undecaprenyl-phosphate glucose phosphotransferase [Motiliproteus sp.]
MSYIKEHSATLLFTQKLIDWLMLVFSCLLSYWVMFDSWALRTDYLLALAVASVVSFWIYPLSSLYRAWRGATRIEEIKAFSLAWLSLFAVMAIIAVGTKTTEQFSRIWFAQWFFGGWLLTLSFRMALRSALGYVRERGFNQRHIVIVGAGELGYEVARVLRASPWLGLTVKGFFSDIKPRYSPAYTSDIPLLGGVSDVDSYVGANDVDQVWIAMALKNMDKIEELIDKLSLTSVDIRFVPDVSGFKLINHSITEIGGVPVINVSVTPMEGASRVIKAVEDRILAAIILLLVSPLMLLLAVGVKLTSPGPVLYRQLRVGWNGDEFEMYKFRSMPVDSERDGVIWGGAKGKKIYPFGRFLRKTSLDELPQFVNVLLGHMSIVGPRPERPQFVDKFKHEIPGYMQKHMVKAGITGWAQINGWRGDTDLRRRIEHDLYYIENWSVWFDIKIIFLTLFKGFYNRSS